MSTTDHTSRIKPSRKHEFFKKEFDRLATDGLIGHPEGKPAYAYIRVSSDEQGDEGRSGLPRQIEHIHEKACQTGYRISWDRVFADDFTGFELERPELTPLRNEYSSKQRRATAVVMEHLDRLSRHADWHQGFLLDEMKQAGIEAVFWKSFSSRIERAVMGAVAQEGMEDAKARMMKGMMDKARSGRVTAKRPAYGYRLVDDHGNEGERARRFSYYAIHEEQAAIVQMIFRRVSSSETMEQVANSLNDRKVPPPKRMLFWHGSFLNVMIKNPTYKGDFIAHRWMQVKVQKPTKDGLSTRTVINKQERPEDEWIHVPVPAIVDDSTWQAANEVMAKNKQMARRNAAQPYLLTGLVRCADCGYAYFGNTARNQRTFESRGYICPNKVSNSQRRRALHLCKHRYISAQIIESAVWNVVCNAVLEPNILLKALEAKVFNEQNAQLERQITYLECEVENKSTEDDKLYRAYVAGVFDETEYAERRRLLKSESAKLNVELSRLYPQRMRKEYFEAQKVLLLRFAERLRLMNGHIDPPFELKHRILKMTVDSIALNLHEKWFRLEGTIRGTHAIENTSVHRC